MFVTAWTEGATSAGVLTAVVEVSLGIVSVVILEAKKYSAAMMSIRTITKVAMMGPTFFVGVLADGRLVGTIGLVAEVIGATGRTGVKGV